MKNKLHGFVAVLIFCTIFTGKKLQAQAQVSGFLYKDALTLCNALKEASPDAEIIKGIIEYYFADDSAAVLQNPFLAKYLPAINSLTRSGDVGAPTGVSSGLFGLNVTKYADGLAKFLIERGKQELSMAFFERLRKDLQKYPELRYIFPETHHIITEIESHNILSLLQELRDAFVKDMLRSPENILSLREINAAECPADNGTCSTRVDGIAKLFTEEGGHDPRPIIIALNVMQSIIDGNNIIGTLNRVVYDQSICEKNDAFNSYIKLASILFESLRTDRESEGLFINEANLRNLFHSPDCLEIFLGLTWQKFNTMPCYAGLDINGKKLEQIFKAILAKRANFFGLLASLDNINRAFLSLKASVAEGGKPDASVYGSFISASLLTTANLVKISSVVIDETKLPEGFSKFFINLDIAADFCIDIQQRNYAGIFNDFIKFVNTNKLFKDDETRTKVVKYLSFGANLASATTSDEVKNALNAVALPPGSYTIKQNASLNLSFNGYIGYAFDFNGGVYAKGVYAPLGFSLSTGLGKKNAGALSLFASFLDVGGVASYRLENGMTDSLKQEIRLESIISPSAQLLYEFPKTPIVICAGWRRTPKLFYSKQNGFETVQSVNAFNLAVLIDIPIFTLMNRPKK